MNTIKNYKRLATVRQMPNFYPTFSQSSLRYLIFNGTTNGFNQCVLKIGRRVLIDLDKFEAWIESHNIGKQ